jgi:hypothetical protein
MARESPTMWQCLKVVAQLVQNTGLDAYDGSVSNVA